MGSYSQAVKLYQTVALASPRRGTAVAALETRMSSSSRCICFSDFMTPAMRPSQVSMPRLVWRTYQLVYLFAPRISPAFDDMRSEEHTSELQSLAYLVC